MVRCPTCLSALRVPGTVRADADNPPRLSDSGDAVLYSCPGCRQRLSALPTQVNQLVRCPHCLRTSRVPAPENQVVAPVPARSATAAAPAPPPRPQEPATVPAQVQSQAAREESALAVAASAAAPPAVAEAAKPMPVVLPPSGQRYGFNCVWCSSRLEAFESQGGSEGTCPTCGQQIVIPIKDRYGRLIDPRTNQIIKPDPHPVHAYAAAGERAPKILRKKDGTQEILCTRCSTPSPITANNCRNCGNPFTIDGTTADAVTETSGLAAASLILGVVSIPTGACLFIFGPLALVLGGVSYYQSTQAGTGKGLATAGIILGAIGTLISAWTVMR